MHGLALTALGGALGPAAGFGGILGQAALAVLIEFGEIELGGGIALVGRLAQGVQAARLLGFDLAHGVAEQGGGGRGGGRRGRRGGCRRGDGRVSQIRRQSHGDARAGGQRRSRIGLGDHDFLAVGFLDLQAPGDALAHGAIGAAIEDDDARSGRAAKRQNPHDGHGGHHGRAGRLFRSLGATAEQALAGRFGGRGRTGWTAGAAGGGAGLFDHFAGA